jgi:formiminotetrahydrofolate cyclodeaminase
MTVGEFAAALSEASPSPAGGSTAALTVTLAAGLCVMAARLSARQLPEAEQLAAEARWLRDQAAPLAQADAEAYGAVLAARRRSPGGADEERRAGVGAALARASEVPLEVARIGTGVAELAARLAAGGNPAVRGDAVAAALLAAAAARTSAVLVRINAAGQPGGHGLTPTERPAHTQRPVQAERSAQAEPPVRTERVAPAERVARAERYARDAERYARDAERYAREAADRQ